MKSLMVLLGSLAVIVVSSQCGRPSPAVDRDESAGATPRLRITSIELAATREGGVLEVPAVIESTRRAILTSRSAALIVEFAPREGDFVPAGALLARLDHAGLASALAAAIASDQAAARDLARAETLLGKGAATRSEVENATTALSRTHAEVAAAREALSYTVIKAPFAGRIRRKLASLGDSTHPSQPLLEIEGQGGLEVVASVESAVMERLKPGGKVRVRVDGLSEDLIATVHSLAPSADPSTHRFTLRADVPEKPGVRAGLFARLSVAGPGTESRILVPVAALLRRGGLSGVYVIRDGRAWLRWIAAGDAFGDFVEARAGIEAGERVALEPSRLHDGALVEEGR